jgi:hypothetical protein
MFCFKVRERLPVWFDPTVRVHHIFRESLGAYLRNQRMLGRYTLIYLRQTGPNALYGGVRPVLLLPTFVLLKVCRIVARILRTRDAVKVAGFLYSLAPFVAGLTHWSTGFFQGSLGQPGKRG